MNGMTRSATSFRAPASKVVALSIISWLGLVASVHAAPVEVDPSPIVIGQSYALPSSTYGGPRELNVWLPPSYGEGSKRYPVVYLLDGGQAQDFHHISGLAQLGTISGTTRDVIVVGVASVDRRNELALPTSNPKLIETYPTQGQSARFRRFLLEEVQPFVRARYRTSGETALVGESLAGLFVVETYLTSPKAFDHYVAVSPSLWWDGGQLARRPTPRPCAPADGPRSLYLSIGDEGGEMQAAVDTLVARLRQCPVSTLALTYSPRPDQSHSTIYHPVALDALRQIFSAPEGE